MLPFPVLTKEQRAAIFRLYNRTEKAVSYRAFRKAVFHTIGCDGAIVVPFAGMFVAIERDGYAHS